MAEGIGRTILHVCQPRPCARAASFPGRTTATLPASSSAIESRKMSVDGSICLFESKHRGDHSAHLSTSPFQQQPQSPQSTVGFPAAAVEVSSTWFSVASLYASAVIGGKTVVVLCHSPQSLHLVPGGSCITSLHLSPLRARLHILRYGVK